MGYYVSITYHDFQGRVDNVKELNEKLREVYWPGEIAVDEKGEQSLRFDEPFFKYHDDDFDAGIKLIAEHLVDGYAAIDLAGEDNRRWGYKIYPRTIVNYNYDFDETIPSDFKSLGDEEESERYYLQELLEAKEKLQLRLREVEDKIARTESNVEEIFNVVYWEDEEAREHGISELYGSYKLLDEAIEEAKRLWERMDYPAVEVINTKTGEVEWHRSVDGEECRMRLGDLMKNGSLIYYNIENGLHIFHDKNSDLYGYFLPSDGTCASYQATVVLDRRYSSEEEAIKEISRMFEKKDKEQIKTGAAKSAPKL